MATYKIVQERYRNNGTEYDESAVEAAYVDFPDEYGQFVKFRDSQERVVAAFDAASIDSVTRN